MSRSGTALFFLLGEKVTNNRIGKRGGLVLGLLVAVLLVIGAVIAVSIIQTGKVGPWPTSIEENAQPQPEKLPQPRSLEDTSSKCGAKGEVNGLDPQNVLGFEGLCVPLTLPSPDYAKWTTGDEGDWSDNGHDVRGKVSLSQPSGSTIVSLHLTPGTPSLKETARAYTRECVGLPKVYTSTKIRASSGGSLAALHVYARKCTNDGDQFDHDWFIKLPNGHVIVIVAESPEQMRPGATSGSSTPARVGESIRKAKYFG